MKREAPEIHDVIGSGDHAAILARERWHDGDDVVELNRVLVYHARDGKLSAGSTTKTSAESTRS